MCFVVGSRQTRDSYDKSRGAAFVYCPESGSTNFQLVATISGPQFNISGGITGAACGSSVYHNGTRIFMTCKKDEDLLGYVHIFDGNLGAWERTSNLTASLPIDSKLGHVMDVGGDVIVVDALDSSLATDNGIVTVFHKDPSSLSNGYKWQENMLFDVSSSVLASRNLATTVSLSEDGLILIVGSSDENSNAGAVYISKWNSTAGSYRLLARMGGSGTEKFGASAGVTLSAGRYHFCIGGPQLYNPDGGVYCYVFYANTTNWYLTQTIQGPSWSRKFGYAMSYTGRILVAQTINGHAYHNNGGGAYVFVRRNDDTYQFEYEIYDNDRVESKWGQASSISTKKNLILVGTQAFTATPSQGYVSIFVAVYNCSHILDENDCHQYGECIWRGSNCSNCVNGEWNGDNCTCFTGWNGTTCTEALCSPSCVHGQCADYPNTCNCTDSWSNDLCDCHVGNEEFLNGLMWGISSPLNMTAGQPAAISLLLRDSYGANDTCGINRAVNMITTQRTQLASFSAVTHIYSASFNLTQATQSGLTVSVTVSGSAATTTASLVVNVRADESAFYWTDCSLSLSDKLAGVLSSHECTLIDRFGNNITSGDKTVRGEVCSGSVLAVVSVSYRSRARYKMNFASNSTGKYDFCFNTTASTPIVSRISLTTIPNSPAASTTYLTGFANASSVDQFGAANLSVNLVDDFGNPLDRGGWSVTATQRNLLLGVEEQNPIIADLGNGTVIVQLNTTLPFLHSVNVSVDSAAVGSQTFYVQAATPKWLFPYGDSNTTTLLEGEDYSITLGASRYCQRPVTVPLSCSGSHNCSVTPITLTLQSLSSNFAPQITLSIPADNIAERSTYIRLQVGESVSLDSECNGIAAKEFWMVVNDTTPVGVSLVSLKPQFSRVFSLGEVVSDRRRFVAREGFVNQTHVATCLLSSPRGTSVVINFAPLDTDLQASSSLTFNCSNWNIPQTVKLWSNLDGAIVGIRVERLLVSVSESVPGSTRYGFLSDVHETVLVIDSEGSDALLISSPYPSSAVSELSGSTVVWVGMRFEPVDAYMTIASTISDSNHVLLSGSNIPMSAENYTVIQEVSLTGIHDRSQTGNISLSLCSSIVGLASSERCHAMTVIDKDVAAINMSVSGQNTTEFGDKLQVTVRLLTKPLKSVSIELISSDIGEVKVSPSVRDLSPESWMNPVFFTLEGVPDGIPFDGDADVNLLIDAKSTDTFYDALSLSFVIKNLDIPVPSTKTVSPDVIAMAGGQEVIIVGGGYDEVMQIAYQGAVETVFRVKGAGDRSRASFISPIGLYKGYAQLKMTNRRGGTNTMEEEVFITDDCPNRGEYGRGADCNDCPIEAECPGGLRMWPKPGFWTPSEDALFVSPCPVYEACLGGRYSACADGYTGDYCATCKSGYEKGSNGKCNSCADYAIQAPLLILASLIFVAMLYICVIFLSDEPLYTIVWALVTFQLVRAVVMATDSSLPAFLHILYSFLALTTVDFAFLKPGCSLSGNAVYIYFFGNLLIHGLVYSVALCLLTVVALIKRNKHYFVYRVSQATAVFYVIFYQVNAYRSFQIILCSPRPDGSYRLVADPSTVCFDQGHLPIFVFALALLIVDHLLIPILIFWTLLYARMTGKLRRRAVFKIFGYFFESCKLNMFWFFLLTFALTLLLAFFAVLFVSDNAASIVAVTLSLLAFLAVFLFFRPMRHLRENILESLTILISIFETFLGQGGDAVSSTHISLSYLIAALRIISLCSIGFLLVTFIVHAILTIRRDIQRRAAYNKLIHGVGEGRASEYLLTLSEMDQMRKRSVSISLDLSRGFEAANSDDSEENNLPNCTGSDALEESEPQSLALLARRYSEPSKHPNDIRRVFIPEAAALEISPEEQKNNTSAVRQVLRTQRMLRASASRRKISLAASPSAAAISLRNLRKAQDRPLLDNASSKLLKHNSPSSIESPTAGGMDGSMSSSSIDDGKNIVNEASYKTSDTTALKQEHSLHYIEDLRASKKNLSRGKFGSETNLPIILKLKREDRLSTASTDFESDDLDSHPFILPPLAKPREQKALDQASKKYLLKPKKSSLFLDDDF
jgi:hypothetical protein